MSTFYVSDEKSIRGRNIILSYPSYNLYTSEITINNDSLGLPYLEFNYTYQQKSTNFIDASAQPQTYFTSNAYIFNLLHTNIDGVDPTAYVGELVIEHTAATITNKIYACFLLQSSGQPSSTRTDNDIDTIVATSTAKTPPASITISPSIALQSGNPTIPQQNKYIKYTDNNTGNIVYVFLNPIQVNESTATTIAGYSSEAIQSMFNIYGGANYSLNQTSGNTNDTSDIYIDCSPTGVSEEEIKTYSLPIYSDMMNGKSQLDFMKTAVNFFIFVILIGFVYISIPQLYRSVVVNVVSKIEELSSEEKKLKRIRSIDYFITGVAVLTILVSFSTGFANDDSGSLTTGLFLFVIFILSFVLIQNKKMNDKKWMNNLTYKPGDYLDDYIDFFAFMGEGFAYLLNKASQFYFSLLLVLIILLIIPLTTGNIDSDTGRTALTIIAMILIPISVMIKLMVDYPDGPVSISDTNSNISDAGSSFRSTSSTSSRS
jgi:hypothetical protein